MKFEKLYSRFNPAISAVIVIGLISLGLILYMHSSAGHIIDEEQYFLINLGKADTELAEGHLWLDEYLSGYMYVQREKVLEIFEGVVKKVDQMIQRTEAFHTPELFENLVHLRGLIAKTYETAQKLIKSEGLSSIGSVLDRQFDKVYIEAKNALVVTYNSANRHTRGMVMVQHRVHYTLMLLWPVLIVGVSIVLYRYSRSREKMKEHLEAEQQKISDILKTVGEGIIVIGEDSLIQYANRELLDIFGYTFKEIAGKNIQVLMPEEYRDAHVKAMGGYLEGALPKVLGKRVIMEGLRKDGSMFPLEIRIEESKLSDRPRFFTAAIRDITERKKAKEELNRLAAAINQSEDSIVITDTDGNIIYVNPAFENLAGFTSKETIGQNSRILKSGKQNDSFYKELWDTITSGKTWRGRFINKKKNGQEFIEEATITPVRDLTGKNINYVAVKRDITAALQLEKQMRQSQKMDAMGKLAGGIAHDFNNILTGIIGYTEISQDNLPEKSESYNSLEEVLRACNRAKDLVKQILTFTREAGQELKPMQPHLVINESINLLRASIPSSIEIRADISNESGVILGNSTQITQLVMNLCTNAQYAMSKTGGVLDIKLEPVDLDANLAYMHKGLKAGPHIRLTVSDTGCGMNQETLEHILEPFFTTKPKSEGTGMGLSVVHGIVSSHGGALIVESEVGQGTVFKVYIPRGDIIVSVDEKNRTPVPKGNESILFVDDEETIVSMSKKMLGQLGYKVFTTTDPVEALEMIKNSPQKFDILITDFTMPAMNGSELTRKIIRIRKDMPVILCTGYGSREIEKNVKEAGVRDVIHKPFVKRTLAEIIRKVLDEKQT